MNEHKHSDRHHSQADGRSDDDQLRPETTNEIIREAMGSEDTDLSRVSNDDGRSGDYASRTQEIQGSDLTQGMSLNPNDASAVRSGGTTDMDDQAVGGAGLATGERGSSNLTTRRTVTGSDFDGQDKTS